MEQLKLQHYEECTNLNVQIKQLQEENSTLIQEKETLIIKIQNLEQLRETVSEREMIPNSVTSDERQKYLLLFQEKERIKNECDELKCQVEELKRQNMGRSSFSTRIPEIDTTEKIRLESELKNLKAKYDIIAQENLKLVFSFITIIEE